MDGRDARSAEEASEYIYSLEKQIKELKGRLEEPEEISFTNICNECNKTKFKTKFPKPVERITKEMFDNACQDGDIKLSQDYGYQMLDYIEYLQATQKEV